MADTPFLFKRFSIHHGRTAMKVGTDGVILGAIAGSGSPENILEIGVGSGVVSLMMAQRFPEAKIQGMEIDQSAWQQATENAQKSPWNGRIDFFNKSFQEYCEQDLTKFDLIVSNPPYFSNHLKSPDPKKNLALHSDALPFTDLSKGVLRLLGREGEFWVILPPEQMGILEKILLSSGLNVIWEISIKDSPTKNILRKICVFSFNIRTKKEKNLCIKNENGSYSDAYSKLLMEFLIIF